MRKATTLEVRAIVRAICSRRGLNTPQSWTNMSVTKGVDNGMRSVAYQVGEVSGRSMAQSIKAALKKQDLLAEITTTQSGCGMSWSRSRTYIRIKCAKA